MAKNTVQNAKTAARKVLTAVVDKVKAKTAGKVKDAPKTDPVKVKPDVPKAKKKDTPDGSNVSKDKKVKKGKKKEDLSVPRNAVDKATRKGLHKAVEADSVTTATNTLGRGSNRAKVFGVSASALWRALGARKVKGEFAFTTSDARAVRDGLGLGDVITDTNVKLQFSDGRGRANGNDPLYGGDVPELDPADWKVINAMVTAAREE